MNLPIDSQISAADGGKGEGAMNNDISGHWQVSDSYFEDRRRDQLLLADEAGDPIAVDGNRMGRAVNAGSWDSFALPVL